MSTSEPVTAFDEFLENLDFARGLVKAGRALAAVRAGVVDVEDIYRAAWSQSVAGLDHWVTREITERAVALALNPDLPRPPRFSKLEIPVEAFERVYQGNGELGEVLRQCWGEKLARVTHQRPGQIKEGLGYVMEGDLWKKVADVMSVSGPQIKPDQVRQRLDQIVDRRNQIAHTADRNPSPPPARAELTDEAVVLVIDWLESMAQAMLAVMGGSLNPDDLGLPSADDTPVPAGARWDEPSLLQALERAPKSVRDCLLAVYRHAETHPAFRGWSFGTGKFPSATASFRVGTAEASVWSIYTDPGNAVLSINFEWMLARGIPVERLERLVDGLMPLPKASAVLRSVIDAGYAKRPSLSPLMLMGGAGVVTQALDELLAVDVQDETGLPPREDKTVTYYLNRSKPDLINLYEHLEQQLLGLGDDVTKKTRKFYFAFQRTQNFACVEVYPQNNELKIFVKVNPDDVDLEEGFSRDVRNIGHIGTGDLELRVKTSADVSKAFPLIQRSYTVS
ncbi:DUF5655 domain-containing protein [Nonomuraea sp. NPDC049158]|uniref:DUF5655 domain-containing protein n=1 Tax=Nonomuraea sp. NPDC049158 TaxID=3155649 RepID=UPI0033E468FB